MANAKATERLVPVDPLRLRGITPSSHHDTSKDYVTSFCKRSAFFCSGDSLKTPRSKEEMLTCGFMSIKYSSYIYVMESRYVV